MPKRAEHVSKSSERKSRQASKHRCSRAVQTDLPVDTKHVSVQTDEMFQTASQNPMTSLSTSFFNFLTFGLFGFGKKLNSGHKFTHRGDGNYTGSDSDLNSDEEFGRFQKQLRKYYLEYKRHNRNHTLTNKSSRRSAKRDKKRRNREVDSNEKCVQMESLVNISSNDVKIPEEAKKPIIVQAENMNVVSSQTNKRRRRKKRDKNKVKKIPKNGENVSEKKGNLSKTINKEEEKPCLENESGKMIQSVDTDDNNPFEFIEVKNRKRRRQKALKEHSNSQSQSDNWATVQSNDPKHTQFRRANYFQFFKSTSDTKMRPRIERLATIHEEDEEMNESSRQSYNMPSYAHKLTLPNYREKNYIPNTSLGTESKHDPWPNILFTDKNAYVHYHNYTHNYGSSNQKSKMSEIKLRNGFFFRDHHEKHSRDQDSFNMLSSSCENKNSLLKRTINKNSSYTQFERLPKTQLEKNFKANLSNFRPGTHNDNSNPFNEFNAISRKSAIRFCPGVSGDSQASPALVAKKYSNEKHHRKYSRNQH